MNFKKLLLSTVIGGIVANVFDGLLHGAALSNTYKSFPTLINQHPSVPMFLVADFIAAFVFAVVYEQFKGSATPGSASGARFGFFAGLLVTFPGMLAMLTMFQGFPSWLAWVWVLAGIMWYVLMGAVVGAIYQKVK